MKKATHLLAIWAISLLATFLAHAALAGPIGHDLDFFFLYKVLRGVPSDKIAIVKIDNASLDELEKTDLRVLNYSKTVFSNLIDRLESGGASAIGLDIIFANRSADQEVLAKTLENRKNVVIAAKVGTKGDSERVLPLETYSGATWGMIDVLFDKNVVSKILPHAETASGRSVESFSIAIYRAMVGDSSPAGVYRDEAYVINPLRSVPVAGDKSALIPFFREPKTYPAYSLSDVLAGKHPKDAFKGKAVLVGEYGTLIHDSHFSPVDLGAPMPGVEFHANFLDGIITGKFLRPLSDAENVSLVAVASFASIAVFLFSSVAVSIAYAVAFLALSLFAGWYAIAAHGIVPSYFLLSLAGAFAAFPVSYAYRYFVVDGDRRFIEKAFSRYVDPEVVEAIASDPASLDLGGAKRDVTVFFSDIAGFTTISETLGAERLFSLIGEYLSQMTDILIKNRGTLDKYIGDAVMGFFGAPLSMENPEAAACRTALEQQARLRMLRTKWKKEGIPPVVARIGIHAGEAMVGNVGSKTRFNYTAMGDTVNLASRLEGVNKEYGTYVCVSETVAERAKKEFVFRELDIIKVKGKTEGVRIFELVGFADDPHLDRAKIERYENALAAYRSGDFAEAKRRFEENVTDLPSIMMSLRCESLIRGETSLENGTYSMKTK